MSEQSKGFTVNDRRHFTADGSPRVEQDEKPDEKPEPAEPPASAPAPEEGVDFASFLLSLAGQASQLLGLSPEPGADQKADLAGARQIISILEMLRDKTEGRRSP